MSILLEFHQDDKMNDHLQKAINEWQKQYDLNETRCKNSSQRDLVVDEKEEVHQPSYGSNTTSIGSRELLKDETPFGRGGWDPFHRSLERSIYFWGYWGTLTEPPCSTFVAWRGKNDLQLKTFFCYCSTT